MKFFYELRPISDFDILCESMELADAPLKSTKAGQSSMIKIICEANNDVLLKFSEWFKIRDIEPKVDFKWHTDYEKHFMTRTGIEIELSDVDVALFILQFGRRIQLDTR